MFDIVKRFRDDRALANRPAILLLDEPTGDLDSKNTDIVMELLLNLNRTALSVHYPLKRVQYRTIDDHILLCVDAWFDRWCCRQRRRKRRW